MSASFEVHYSNRFFQLLASTTNTRNSNVTHTKNKCINNPRVELHSHLQLALKLKKPASISKDGGKPCYVSVLTTQKLEILYTLAWASIPLMLYLAHLKSNVDF